MHYIYICTIYIYIYIYSEVMKTIQYAHPPPTMALWINAGYGRPVAEFTHCYC